MIINSFNHTGGSEMDAKIEKALEFTLSNWEYMLNQENDNGFSDEFMSAFYRLSDVLRDWVNGLEQRPNTVEELLESPTIKEILEKLPEELHLNFHTQLGLIIDNKTEVDI